MVSAEQSMQITKCGSPIWGWRAEHNMVRNASSAKALPLGFLKPPVLPRGFRGTGLHSSSSPE
jgi:hypothetical protein